MWRRRLRSAGLRICVGITLIGLLTGIAPEPLREHPDRQVIGLVHAATAMNDGRAVTTYVYDGNGRENARFVIAVPLLAASGAKLMTALIFSVGTVVTVTTTQQAINYCKRRGCSVNLAKARTAVQRPDPNSHTAKTDKNLYIGYEIFYGRKTYKYGISLARRGVERPQEQLRKCNHYFGVLGGCAYRILTRKVGYLNARWWEFGRITGYFIMHGHCPPGQLPSCK